MVKTIAEIGINYAYGKDKNDFIKHTKELIDIAKFSGFDYVKFQKRNPDICVPDDQKDKLKSVPWMDEPITYLQYKKDIEFGADEYDQIDAYCKDKDIKWFASVWDKDSVDFMKGYVDIMKIPSAKIDDIELIKYARQHSRLLMISTGMSNEDEILEAYEAGHPNVLFHTNSTYPSPINELNLGYITWLKEKYSNSQIGYSGHEWGLTTTMAAVGLGAKWIERHVTLNRTEWGSDQASSVEPTGMLKLIKGIKDIEIAIKTGYGPREVIGSEKSKRESLRGK